MATEPDAHSMGTVENEALAVLPRGWMDRLAGKAIIPVTTGMSGASVFHVKGGIESDHYLKIATGAAADLIRADRLAGVHGRPRSPYRGTFHKHRCSRGFDDRSRSHTAEHISSSDWQRWVREIGRAFAQLHSLPVAICPFDETLGVRLSRAAAAVQSGCVDPGEFDERNSGITPNELYGRLVASVPEREDLVITHGDATLSNLILTDHGQIGFVDCSHVGKADRYVDLALMVAGLEGRFGTDALASFGEGYGGLSWDSKKSEFTWTFMNCFDPNRSTLGAASCLLSSRRSGIKMPTPWAQLAAEGRPKAALARYRSRAGEALGLFAVAIFDDPAAGLARKPFAAKHPRSVSSLWLFYVPAFWHANVS